VGKENPRKSVLLSKNRNPTTEKMDALSNIAPVNVWIHGAVVLAAAIVTMVTFAFLIPLDSVPAVSGVTITLVMSYVIGIVIWLIVMSYYSNKKESLLWFNTHILFLVILPATIAATAMNVISIQNTRNLIAGNITS
jgi:hypothetical protein